MRRFRLRGVLDSTGAVLAGGEITDTELRGVSTDTRTLEPGELFLALSGPNFDGNRFAQAALEKGAGALLLRDDEAARELGARMGVPVALHPDPRRALADLAGWYRSTLTAPVVAITGSCGKTTTKNILRELLGHTLRTVASPSSFNNDIGVPHTLLLAQADTQLVAVELGTNHPGEIAALCRIARPNAGVITNVGAAHLEGLGSLAGVAQEKGDLAAAVPKEGFIVVNADCPFTPAIADRTRARVLTFAVGGPDGRDDEHNQAPVDLRATDLYFHSGGTTFRLNGIEVTSPLLGTHNVQNLLAALGVAVGLGLPLEEVLPGVSAISGGRQRMERHDLEGLTLFDDTYNSNPDALRAAVRVLSGLHGFKRRVLVLGDMLELGDLAAELHHRVGREAAEAGIDELRLVGELSKAAAAGALEGGLSASAVQHFPDTQSAAEGVAETLGEGDAVLVKGSRGMRLELVVEAIQDHWGARWSGGR